MPYNTFRADWHLNCCVLEWFSNAWLYLWHVQVNESFCLVGNTTLGTDQHKCEWTSMVKRNEHRCNCNFTCWPQKRLVYVHHVFFVCNPVEELTKRAWTNGCGTGNNMRGLNGHNGNGKMDAVLAITCVDWKSHTCTWYVLQSIN